MLTFHLYDRRYLHYTLISLFSFFNLFVCVFFFTFMRASMSVRVFLFFNLLSCFFHLCILILMTTLFCFKVPDFFLFVFLSTFHIFSLSSSSYKFLMEYPVEVRAPREVHLVISYEKVLFFFVSFLLPSFFTRCFSNTHEITRSFISAIECHHSVS